ncbi:aminoacyl-tRNA hydrolase [Candidatus Saccharibacteria bacterium]|nr:aminoacyl-tRNA hydrolase [Candidatus Saccharibacteria bacterium]
METKIIIFLGNPGLKYRKTRHNIGFMVGDFWAREMTLKWKDQPKFGATTAETIIDGQKTILAKPQLYYNRTGEVVQKLCHFYKISVSDILVVCDDFNLDFGTLRLRQKGSDGGNNGLKSTIAAVGNGFARLRIGTSNEKRAQMGDTDFVLAKLSREEQAKIPEIVKNAVDIVHDFLLEDLKNQKTVIK